MKLERNLAIIRYKRDHPKSSLASIGRIFHISRQRVSIILNSHKGGLKSVKVVLEAWECVVDNRPLSHVASYDCRHYSE